MRGSRTKRWQRPGLGLAELVHPLSPGVFLSDYWQQKPYVRHGPLERFAGLAAIPELASIDGLLASWRGQAEAWAPRGSGNPVITAEVDQLSGFFDSGYTLYLSRVEHNVPALVPFARTMELELGLRTGDIYFEAFISQGKGSVVHFDPNVTINIQLLGSKTWWMAENEHVVHPHLGWGVGTEVDEQMLGYARQPFPTRMPRGATSFEARRGTLVYLHPGYWHSTSNHEPSLSLLYTINPPSWTDLLVEELRAQLLRVDDARELAFGLGSTAGMADKQQRLQILLRELSGAVARLDPEALLAKWGGSLTASFERCPSTDLRVEQVGRGGAAARVVVKRSGRKAKTIELALDAVPLVRWILAHHGPFRGHEVAAKLPAVSPERVVELLDALEGAGALIKRRGGAAPADGRRG
jgi:50S ribosomal protein L16 3-hydroxylase